MQVRTTVVCLFPLALTLCAAGPPPEGVDVNLHAGTGSFEYASGGCGGPEYSNRAQEFSGYASGRYRHSSGLGAVGEATFSAGETVDSRLVSRGSQQEDPPPMDEDELGRQFRSLVLASRAGYHHDYFGAEAGIVGMVGVAEVLPSASAWVGVPRYAFIWGDFLAGPYAASHIPVDVGVGHSSDRARAQLGLGLIEPSMSLEGAFRPSKKLPLFAGGRVRQYLTPDQRGTTGALTLAYTF